MNGLSLFVLMKNMYC